MYFTGWGIAWRIFFSRFALVRELFGLNENDKSKKNSKDKREFTSRHSPRNGLKQRHTKKNSKTISSKNHEHSIDTVGQGSSMINHELMIVDEPQPRVGTLNSEEIDEFFSITNADVKDIKKPKNAVLETFDPLNS